MLTFLLILGAIVFGAVFGAGALAALAEAVFNFFKGLFKIGYGCSKALIDLFIILLVTALVLLCMAKCN